MSEAGRWSPSLALPSENLSVMERMERQRRVSEEDEDTDPGITDPFLQVSPSSITLLLALVLVDLQNTCKKKLNRKMLEKPNICYIFDKLRVQGCQI